MKEKENRESKSVGFLKSPWLPIVSYVIVTVLLLGVAKVQFEQSKILAILFLVLMGCSILWIAITAVYQFYRKCWLVAFINLIALPLILFLNFKIFSYVFKQIEADDSPGIMLMNEE